MTHLTLTRPAARVPQTPAATQYVAAPQAFRVLRAWRAWAARRRDGRATGFTLVRGAPDGPLMLASENLSAGSLAAIASHSHQRVGPVPASPAADTTLELARAGAPRTVTPLRALDDWTIEVLLRTGAAVTRSLIVGLRHCEGRYEVVTWTHPDAPAAGGDTHTLLGALAPWAER